MAIDKAALEKELRIIITDSSLAEMFGTWLNEAQEEVALDFDLPTLKLLTPASLAVTTTDWLYDPPTGLGAISTIAIIAGGTGYAEGDILTVVQTGGHGGRLVVTEVALGVVTAIKLVDGGTGYSTGTKTTAGGTGVGCTISVSALVANQVTFHKNLFRATDSVGNFLTIPSPSNPFRFDDLDRMDVNHSDTGPHVTHLAVSEDGSKMGIHPKANETLSLWFYIKPTPMTLPTDVPAAIPEAFRKRVLIPKVVIKNFKYLQDLMSQPPHQSLQWWQGEYMNGLYGTGGEIGMLNYFARNKRPRRHGGRDPIGWRWNQ